MAATPMMTPNAMPTDAPALSDDEATMMVLLVGDTLGDAPLDPVAVAVTDGVASGLGAGVPLVDDDNDVELERLEVKLRDLLTSRRRLAGEAWGVRPFMSNIGGMASKDGLRSI